MEVEKLIMREREEREREREGGRERGEGGREGELNLPALNKVHGDPVFMKQLNLSQHNRQCYHKVLQN